MSTIPPVPYHKKKFLRYGCDPCDNLYRYAEDRKRSRFEIGRSQGDEKYLIAIEEEIKIRTKITQQEIFYIGELLSEAREVIKSVKDVSFKEWIDSRFEFSYHTALNFCNVYGACLGHIEEIKNIPISVLYKISKPSFPTELRDYLFNSGAIEGMKLSQCKILKDKFEEKGIDAIRPKLKGIAEAAIAIEQINHVANRAHEAIHKLSVIQKTLQNDGFDIDASKALKSEQGHYEKANMYQRTIYDAFTNCIELLQKAIDGIKFEAVYSSHDGKVISEFIIKADSENTDSHSPAKAGNDDSDAVVESEYSVDDSDVVGSEHVIEAQFTETDKGE